VLPYSTDIIVALNRIIKAFESLIEIGVIKTRWGGNNKIKELLIIDCPDLTSSIKWSYKETITHE